jgi:hypothetical protein
MRKKMHPKENTGKKERKRKNEAKCDARSVIEMMRTAEHIFVFSPI